MALSDGLIHLWELEEASGDRVDSINGFNLSPSGTPSNAVAKSGLGMLTTSSSDFVRDSVTPHTQLLGLDEITVAGWAYFTTTISGQNFINIVTSGASNLLLRFRPTVRDFGIAFRDDNGDVYQVNNGVVGSINTWYHMVGIFIRNDAVYSYLNNVFQLSVPNADFPYDTDTTSPVTTIGVNSGSILDQLGIWSRALSSDERTELYNGGDGVSLSNAYSAGAITRRRRR